jgi:cytochrome c peroxidase
MQRITMSMLLLATGIAGCFDGSGDDDPDVDDRQSKALIAEVRVLAEGRAIQRLQPPPPVRAELVELGRALAFDKVLSGNHDISCMTCHLPELGTGDARSLSIGQGALGLGLERSHPGAAFIPRNAPPLFNLHAMDSLFWDGRVFETDEGVVTPGGAHVTDEMQAVFEFGAVSALPLFPVMSREEMRGVAGTNELSAYADNDFTSVWASLMDRLGDYPEYVDMFEAAYPGTDFDDMTFAHASNAIGGFLVSELAFTETPWDQFLDGDDQAMSQSQLRGAKNFLSARCSICHGGDNLTDGGFHNVALAQFGPGKDQGLLGRDDFGFENTSGYAADRYKFRSTPLRNVELTAPYGHAGQFADLFDFVDHYSESDLKLAAYDVYQLEPLLRALVIDNVDDVLAHRDPLLDGVVFPKAVLADVTTFMTALTDDDARDLADVAPASVPSGLPVDLLPPDKK